MPATVRTHIAVNIMYTFDLGGSHSHSLFHTCTSGNFCVPSLEWQAKTLRAGKWATIRHLREMIACLNNWIAMWKREKPRVSPLESMKTSKSSWRLWISMVFVRIILLGTYFFSLPHSVSFLTKLKTSRKQLFHIWSMKFYSLLIGNSIQDYFEAPPAEAISFRTGTRGSKAQRKGI